MFTSKQNKLINDIFLLCDDLDISDQVKSNIEYVKNNLFDKNKYLFTLINAINELHSIKVFLDNLTVDFFWKQFEKLLKKQEFVKCKILILTIKELIKIYRLKNIDLCSFVIGYFKKKSFFRKNNKIQSLIRTLSLLKTENAQMFWFKIK